MKLKVPKNFVIPVHPNFLKIDNLDLLRFQLDRHDNMGGTFPSKIQAFRGIQFHVWPPDQSGDDSSVRWVSLFDGTEVRHSSG